MIASTGPRISQGRLLAIIIGLIFAAAILSLTISRQSTIGDIEFCRQVDQIFAGSHYVFDEADGICKPDEED